MPFTRRSPFVVVVLVVPLLSVARGAPSQNLITNSTFDIDLSGWSFNPSEASWDPMDVAGSATSGSARVSQGLAGFVSILDQCAPVTAGVQYGMRASAFVPPGQNAQGRAVAEIEWFAGDNCSPGTSLGAWDGALDPRVEGVWSPVQVVQVAPAAARSAKGVLLAWNLNGVFDWIAHFDNAFFGPSVPFSGFVHAPLGQAVLTDGQGGLTISNIGSSGEDGVKIGFGEPDGFELELTEELLATDFEPDSIFQAIIPIMTPAPGARPVPMPTVTSKVVGDVWETVADCSPLGSSN